ncbi:MAG: transcription-repair coupling factor [Candidatus Krumholzibacteriia bacterium]
MTTSALQAGGARAPLLQRLAADPTRAALKRTTAELDEGLRRRPDGGLLVSGLHGGAASLLLAGWFEQTNRTALVVTPSAEGAAQLAEDLEAWLGPEPVAFLPPQEVLAFDRNSPDPALVGDALVALTRLREGPPCLVVTALYGVRQRVIAPSRLAASTLRLRVGDRHDREELCGRLHERGYRPAGVVARMGDFAVRGGLLDVYAPGDDPLRIEFFDDEIVSLRTFDVETQRSSGKSDRARVLPVSHLVLDDDARLEVLARLEVARNAGRLDPDEFDDLEARLEQRLPNDGLEAFLPWAAPTATVSDYLPEGSAVFWWDPVRLGVQSDLLDAELPRLAESRRRRDAVVPEVAELVVPRERLMDSRLPQALLTGSWIEGDESGWWLGRRPGERLALDTQQPELRGGDVARLREDLLRREAAGEQILLLCDNRGQAQRLGDLLEDTEGLVPAARPELGTLTSGFLWPDLAMGAITDHELFERYRRPARVRRRSAQLVKERASLRPGEFVVHLDYGVGRYRGLKRIEVEGSERECLLIEYAGSDRVYVPVENLDKVERYTSDTEAQPTLAKLGTATWLRVTKRARKAIRAMAVELLQLYAARQELQGHAFSADGSLLRALEESFVHEETPDQLTAIADVKRDMEQAQPMDRLVCGDVGFGKTEVALRAAFKAVQDGKQVAVLCPTTLLAHQHGETFSERFRDFPVSVATLSRFKSPKQQREVTAAAREGKLDIVIGTHRLLSRDVRFADLGLLIIDEEHRFGVRHKERIKELRKQVDVMTLSATPIPRTLYMALMGARDMSLIATPPRDRLPIQTELCAFDEEILTEAILRELHRGGQVFFVHNRIETIGATADLLRRLLPHVRIEYAHGQMKEDELEKIMTRFLAHDFDLLVTTAIIESGLDMPRVNTIVIDRADRFGLAQLYQLRGRVGRSHHRAFAYLMTPQGEALTPDARRRLAALEEFQALGSGYHIAMRDLEIRGAGNLLGEEQHGHMEAIGFDLYCRLLEETVAELRGGDGVGVLDVKVDLRMPAYLPDEYVGDPQQKMDLYRRLARLREPGAIGRLRDEFHDRYGPPPEPVEHLLASHRVRMLAARNGVEEVRASRSGVDFFFAGGREPSPDTIRGLMAAGPSGMRFQAVDQFVMRVPAPREQVLAAATVILERLDALRDARSGQPSAGAGDNGVGRTDGGPDAARSAGESNQPRSAR